MNNIQRISEAVVLAGGLGTRLACLVNDVPKPMAPVLGFPFLRFIMDQLSDNSIERVVIAVGYKSESIINYFGDTYRGMDVVYSSEEQPLGTGGATKQALDKCESDWVCVLNGDSYFDIDFSIFDKYIEKLGTSEAYIATKLMKDLSRYGKVVTDRERFVLEFCEKAQCQIGEINGGVYLLKRDSLLDYPKSFSLEKDFFVNMVQHHKLSAIVQNRDFIDIGVPDDYRRANNVLQRRVQSWKLALFDRDGTINVDTGHLHKIDGLDLIESTVKIIKKYNNNPEYKVVVVTNQAGIAKGLYTVKEMKDLHKELNRRLQKKGAHIDSFYYCPHHPDHTGSCVCRKPSPGMVSKAVFDYNAIAAECVMYGDKESDAVAAKSAEVPFCLV